MSSFAGLEIARKGLNVSQTAIDVIGNNVANSNTEGYTRQRVEMEAIPSPSWAGYVENTNSQVGSGVQITQITQIRDQYLDMQYRRENAKLGEYAVKESVFSYVENIFGEPSEYGIAESLSNVFDSFEEFQNNPESETSRVVLKESLNTFTQNMNNTATALYDLQQEQNTAVEFLVSEINASISEIRDLNSAIFSYETSGNVANELRDSRNLLVDKLSGLVGSTSTESANGEFRVEINGQPLVDHLECNYLETRDEIINPATNEKYCEVYWENDNTKVNVTSGELKARLDMRSGDSIDNKGIQSYIDKLDTLAQGMVEKFNEINNAGYTLPYDGNISINNVDIFDDANISAYNISVSDEILDSTYCFAASDELVTEEENWGNSENAKQFCDLRYNMDLLVNGETIETFESYYNQIISELAIDTSSVISMSESQSLLVESLEYEKSSVSDVSINEEMTNLIKYQQTYAASAKMITTIDEMLDILINIGR